jgi:hypothetical protein
MLSRKKSRHDRKIFLKKNKKNLALSRFLGYSLPAMIDSFIQTPEEYEEYCAAMIELATLAEAETPDPEPKEEEEEEEYEEGGEDSYLDSYWEDRFEIDMGDY